MLPTNVMSFMKKMVTTNENPAGAESTDSGTALSKLRQTLSSSLMTAQDKVTKLTPARQPVTSETPATPTEDKPLPFDVTTPKTQKPDVVKPASRTGTCRVCLKSFKPEDFFRTCCECQQKVCEDCASYSKPDENEDESHWRCSICRRKLQSRAQPIMQQDSTDSLLDVPVLEALQRRHSDVKIGSSTLAVSGGGAGALGAGLAPPRSPELRRHSDVSPASLKELEKVAGERREGLRWERELEWRQHKRPGPSPSAGSGGAGAPASVPALVPASTPAPASAPAQVPAPAPASAPVPAPVRRPSFRAGFDLTPSPLSPDASIPSAVSLGVEEERRARRRSSQLVDLAGRALPQTPPCGGPATPPRLMDELRQGSVAGEDIKIVIHDVDSDANFNSRPGAKRRVVLRRDPSDKAHRTRGFGMRVVGGKTGNDGRLFAYIVWTVPGGPAEKGGLQQGDKVLEWGGVPLTDRSFEEVCAVMDRAGDTVELVVEHATDLRMCDLLDEPISLMSLSRKANENLGMQLESEEKAPTSPTRRKLPKTPV